MNKRVLLASTLGLPFALNVGVALAQQQFVSGGTPSAGQLPVGQSGGTYTPQSVTGCTLSATGSLTCAAGITSLVLSPPLTGGTITATGTAGISICNYDTILNAGTSWTSPACVTSNTTTKIEECAAGGGGGGSNSGAEMGVPGGAGAGLILGPGTNLIAASTAYTIAFGNGGTAGAAGVAGGTGGSASIIVSGTTYAALGGAGGAANASVGTMTAGGAAPSNGTVNIAGQNGWESGTGTTGNISAGGNGPFGMGSGAAQFATTGTNGSSATGFCSGGAGGRSSGGSSQTGGTGSGPMLHITLGGS